MLIRAVDKGLLESLRSDFGVVGESDLEALLVEWGVVVAGESVTEYSETGPWFRSGGESFLATATVLIADGRKTGIAAKAACAFGVNPSAQIRSWKVRADLLASHGVRVPQVYAVHLGVAYVELMDSQLPSAERLAEGQCRELGRIAAALDIARFEPIDFLRDLMLKNGHVFYVDFGSDLGGPGVSAGEPARRQLAAFLSVGQNTLAMEDYCDSYEKAYRTVGGQ